VLDVKQISVVLLLLCCLLQTVAHCRPVEWEGLDAAIWRSETLSVETLDSIGVPCVVYQTMWPKHCCLSLVRDLSY